LTVVPAKAGTHTPQPIDLRRLVDDFPQQQIPVVMGPCFRRDDNGVYGSAVI
jgi:hypothetical protein